jgi:parallel beta-helix repeat protein
MKRLLLVLGFFAISFCVLTVRSSQAEVKVANGYPVHNLDTRLNYTNIQAAIDATETLSGHTIVADAGTYYEHVTVTKSLSLFGENRNTTIIDGNGIGPVITLSADNVLIANFTIRNGGNSWSPQDTCIWGHGLSDVLIENSTVMDTSNGIIFHSMYNSSMNHNLAEECGVMGLHFDGDSNCKMVNNMVTNSFQGIVVEKAVGNFIQWNDLINDNLSINFYASAGNLVEGNNFINNTVGIILDACNSSNNFRTNNMTSNTCNLIVWGLSIEAFKQNIDTSNIVDNKTVYYITNSHNLLLNPFNCPNTGYLALVNCTGMTVNDIDLSNNKDGMLIAQSTNNSLVNVTLANAQTNITLSGFSPQPLIHGGLTFFKSNNNLMVNSRIINNSVGICLYESSGNVFYHNSFVDVDKPVISNFQGPGLPASGSCATNKWDNDLEGNYWSGYAVVDWDQDGIGDFPHIIDANNTDRYPLMGMFSEFPINWANRTYSTSTICNSSISDFRLAVVFPHPPSQPWTTSIMFNVSGNFAGSCRIMIPKDVLDGQYVVMLDGFSMPSSMWREMSITNDTTLFLYMTHPAGSHEIWIMGTTWVTEYPTELTLALFMIATLLAVIVYGRNRPLQKTKNKKNGVAGDFATWFGVQIQPRHPKTNRSREKKKGFGDVSSLRRAQIPPQHFSNSMSLRKPSPETSNIH